MKTHISRKRLVVCNVLLGGLLGTSYPSEMSARNQTPLVRSANGLFAEFNFPTRPGIGGCHPDGASSPVSRRHARQPFSVGSTTGNTSDPDIRAFRPFARANPGQLRTRRRATLMAVKRLALSVSTINSPITTGSRCDGRSRFTTILILCMASWELWRPPNSVLNCTQPNSDSACGQRQLNGVANCNE